MRVGGVSVLIGGGPAVAYREYKRGFIPRRGGVVIVMLVMNMRPGTVSDDVVAVDGGMAPSSHKQRQNYGTDRMHGQEFRERATLVQVPASTRVNLLKRTPGGESAREWFGS